MMFCPNCGTQNADNMVQCTNCGQALQAAPGQVPPAAAPAPDIPSYLVQAILVTLFCCLPFGIVSIVYAAQVNGKIASGDYHGAMEASQKAKTWMWVSFGLGLAASLIWLLMVIVGGGMSAASQY
jgi:hypothetical protein